MNAAELQESFNKAIVCIERKDYETALRTLDRILIEDPNFLPAWNERAALLARLCCYFDSILNYTMAIQMNDKEAGFYNNRGGSFMALGYFEKALADYQKTIDLNPTIPEAYDNIAIVMRRIGRIEEAAKYYRKAISYRPDFANAHLGLAMSLLELQQFEEGWKEFEWRWKTGQMMERKLPYPTWAGERNPDKALLLLAEQGFGDVLQFCRYAKAAKERFGGKVYLECRVPVGRLMQRVEGIDKVIIMAEKHPDDIAYSIPLLSLPRVLGTEAGFIGPYLSVDHDLSAYWDGMLKKLPSGLRVGLCWAGLNREDQPVASAIDQRRSVMLSQLEPLGRIKGISLISLQMGPPAVQVKSPPRGMTITDVTKEFEDFTDTAACVDNLDLVITVDTAMVHLAAGLGRPTWMLSRFDGCWRWFGGQPTSPWYPSLRQYRQAKDGEWEPVIEAITRDLQRFVVERRKQAA